MSRVRHLKRFFMFGDDLKNLFKPSPFMSPSSVQRHFSKSTDPSTTAEYIPIEIAQNVLETIHIYTHLPWWSTIVLSCVGLRSLVTLPLGVYQNKLVAKIELLQPTLKELSEALKHRVTIECRRKGLPSQQANKLFKKQLRKYKYDLYKTNGCNPIRIYILPWVQIPLWIILSLALRNISGAFSWNSKVHTQQPCYSDMANEGTLWFKDLTVPDSTGVLPVMLGVANLLNTELHTLKKKETTLRQRTLLMVFRLLSLLMIAVALKMPAAMSLYWCISASYGLLQNICLKLPRVRRLFKISKTPSESATPFRDICSIVAERTAKFLKIQKDYMGMK
ncbi:cytochrome c oxidase assembly protein COX18, mitochondrial-like [Xenia sp. Carnegie-2017]|uniref:cytochrome c oxidase assembly protein COX18, mitochondrial-like n=1 Tax=Xenia sp. Carnegie-2017 TaxID=2897299 RepID=UPI001F04575D|nr:cytochrome c oxidase assembly protein COX18, mitochondrial-like [Xenia sp. Carnegie-2017]